MIIKRVPLATLVADPDNARSHPQKNLDAIKGSLAKFKQVEPLVVNKRTGLVIGGNGRLAAMRDLGWTEADVTEVDLDNTQAAALAIALNRTAETAEMERLKTITTPRTTAPAPAKRPPSETPEAVPTPGGGR